MQAIVASRGRYGLQAIVASRGGYGLQAIVLLRGCYELPCTQILSQIWAFGTSRLSNDGKKLLRRLTFLKKKYNMVCKPIILIIWSLLAEKTEPKVNIYEHNQSIC